MVPTALTTLILASLLLAPVQCAAISRVHSLFEPQPDASIAADVHQHAGHGGHQAGAGIVEIPPAPAGTDAPSEPAADPPARPALDHPPAVAPALSVSVGESPAGRAAPPAARRSDPASGRAVGPEPPPPKPVPTMLARLVV
jgi:hypothetical protein